MNLRFNMFQLLENSIILHCGGQKYTGEHRITCLRKKKEKLYFGFENHFLLLLLSVVESDWCAQVEMSPKQRAQGKSFLTQRF